MSKIIEILEKVKDMLDVEQPTKRASQQNKMSTSAAKAKLDALVNMSMKGKAADLDMHMEKPKKKK